MEGPRLCSRPGSGGLAGACVPTLAIAAGAGRWRRLSVAPFLPRPENRGRGSPTGVGALPSWSGSRVVGAPQQALALLLGCEGARFRRGQEVLQDVNEGHRILRLREVADTRNDFELAVGRYPERLIGVGER